MASPPVDPLTVTCPHCGEPAGSRCGTINDYSRKPHVARVRLARAVAADADPALDEWFPKRGPCGVCGTPGLDQRHRVVDAIADYLASEPDAGDDIAADYQVPAEAVRAVGGVGEEMVGVNRPVNRPPTPQGISALLRKAGFQRSDYGAKGVMWNDATEGYSVWRTYHAGHPGQPYVAVQYVTKEDGREWPERQKESRTRLGEYATALREAGYAALVRDRGKEPPWLVIMTLVGGKEASR